MVTFLTSIAISCFFSVDGIPNTLERIIYAVAWLCAIPLILWTVLTGWETNNHMHWTQLLTADWWRKYIRLHWARTNKGNSWPWRSTQKTREDVELGAHPVRNTQESEATTVADDNVDRQSVRSEVTPKRGKGRRWRVRNFGPVRLYLHHFFTILEIALTFTQ